MNPDSTNKINFGIIGCGRIAPKHAQAVVSNPLGILNAVADIVPLRAHAIQEKYGGLSFSDYHHLLENKQIDVINICTPSGLHAKMAIEALEAGKHVIVEKPMALTIEDSESMVQTAKKVKKKLCVALQNRYNPPIIELKQALDRGDFGALLLCNATIRWYRPQSYYEDGWHGTKSMDGGVLFNQAIHYVDILQWLMGDIDSVFSFTGTLAHKIDIDDACVASLRFKNGSLGSLEASTITFPRNIEGSIAVFGKRGSVKIGGTALNQKKLWCFSPSDSVEEIPALVASEENAIYGESHKRVVDDMIDALINDREPQINGEEGRKSIAIVNAIYRSASVGSSVQVVQ